MSRPVWSKEAPTEAGLYWFKLRTTDKPDGVLRYCRIVEYDGRFIDERGEGPVSQRQTVERYLRWWAGPLPEPEPLPE